MRPEALALAVDLAVSVGGYLLDRHVALVEGEVVAMPEELHGSLDRMIVALPAHLSDALARCDDFEPPVEIVWLLPFAADESHVAIEHGWRAPFDWLRDEGGDPYDPSRTSLVS